MITDAEVAESLYRRATGYSHDAVKIFIHEGQPIQVPYTEYYPPDTTACIFWLKNRQPGKWRDKVEVEAEVARPWRRHQRRGRWRVPIIRPAIVDFYRQRLEMRSDDPPIQHRVTR